MRLYQSDPKLLGLRVLFDPDAIAARLKLWMGIDDLTVKILNIRYKPETSCVVSYEIDAGGVQSYCHAKTFPRDQWSFRRKKYGQASANVLIDDQFFFALLSFPLDPELPGIESIVANPQAFVPKGLFPRFHHEEVSSLTTLAYKPNRRWTARLKFQSGNSCVIKVHDDSTFDRARKSADILKRSTIESLPNRAGRSQRYRSFAYDWLPGEGLRLALDQTARMQPVFEFLDRLHQSVKSFKKTEVVQEPTVGIEAISNYLACIYPPCGSLANQVGHGILTQQPKACRTALIHGDFHERQVLVSSGEIRACDFDSCRVGDPTSDFGNFVAHLRYRSYTYVNLVDDCAMRHIRDKHGLKALNRYQWHQTAALYRLATNSFRNGEENWVSQTLSLVSEVAKRLEAAGNATSSTRIRAPLENEKAVGAPKLPLATLALKNDASLAFLASALVPESAESVFKQNVSAIEEKFGDYQVQDVIVKRHKEGRRCLIEYKLLTDLGEHSILGKVSAKRLDTKTFDAQKALHEDHGFGYGAADQISVPQTIGYFKPWKMWFQQTEDVIHGIKPLKQNTLGKFTDNIAAAMVKLHTSGFKPAREHRLADELRILRNRLSQVKTEFPAESERIADVISHCFAIADTIDDSRLDTIHRDFYHDQIMFSDQRTVLVDLDLLALGHPALDVGNFLAHLSEYGIRYFDDAQYWQREEDMIVDRYLSAMRDITKQEIAAFKALSLARHIHTSWSRTSRRRITSKIIDETTRLIRDLLPASYS